LGCGQLSVGGEVANRVTRVKEGLRQGGGTSSRSSRASNPCAARKRARFLRLRITHAVSLATRGARSPRGGFGCWRGWCTATKQLRIAHGRDFGWEIAHAAASRRPPISLDSIVARIEGYTYDTKVWDSSLVQGPLSVAPCRTPIVRFATVSSLYRGGVAPGARVELMRRVTLRWVSERVGAQPTWGPRRATRTPPPPPPAGWAACGPRPPAPRAYPPGATHAEVRKRASSSVRASMMRRRVVCGMMLRRTHASTCRTQACIDVSYASMHRCACIDVSYASMHRCACIDVSYASMMHRTRVRTHASSSLSWGGGGAHQRREAMRVAQQALVGGVLRAQRGDHGRGVLPHLPEGTRRVAMRRRLLNIQQGFQ
jgi:hypothetical protein